MRDVSSAGERSLGDVMCGIFLREFLSLDVQISDV